MLKYIELKTGHSNNGPAWIGRVTESKSGRTLYFNGRSFKRESGANGNYVDAESGDEYWISKVKKNGADRHWEGSGKVLLERSALEDYLKLVKFDSIDPEKIELTDDILNKPEGSVSG